jgi:hypothetical protein
MNKTVGKCVGEPRRIRRSGSGIEIMPFGIVAGLSEAGVQGILGIAM